MRGCDSGFRDEADRGCTPRSGCRSPFPESFAADIIGARLNGQLKAIMAKHSGEPSGGMTDDFF